ncbi:steT, partial [Symbiodinium sp. CCMP2456]
MAPIAAHLIRGIPIDSLGDLRDRPLVAKEAKEKVLAKRMGDEIHGHFVYADSFGNSVTNIFAEDIPDQWEANRIHIGSDLFHVDGLIKTYGEREPGSLVALIGSSGQLELAVVQGNAAQKYGFEYANVPSRISGKVVSISETGDAITDLAHDQLADVPQDDRTSIECGGHTTLGVYPLDHDQPEMTYVAILGKSGCLELSLIGDSAAKFLGLKVNDEVTIKRFGFWAAYFLVVASMVGAGILTSSGFTLHDTANPAGLMMIWTLGGILALCGTVTIAELATMLPKAGSDYLFVREAYGREAGIVVGWATFVLGFAAPTAVVARLSANYLSIPVSQVISVGPAEAYLEPLLATAFVVVLMVTHCLGHRESSGIQVLSTLVKITLLVGLVVIGLLFGEGDWGHFAASHVPDSNEVFTLGIGLIYVSYAYTGWNAAAYVAGEVRDPERLLPRSLIAGCLSVMGLYLLVNLTYIFALDPQEMTQRSIPEVIPVAQFAAKEMFGNQVGDVVSVLLGLGMLASVSAYMLSGPRIAFAMANDG